MTPASESTPPRRGRPRLDDEMVPAILDAAERLFSRRDSLDVSIREIAAEAGIPHSAIYRYFTGKDEIFRQVLQRGEDRQFGYESERRAAGTGARGTVDWIINQNRSYVLALTRAALEGQTPSSAGLDVSQSVGQRSRRVLTERDTPFEVRTGQSPEVVIAAAMALTIGWVSCEDWIVESVGLADLDRRELRAAIDDLIVSLVLGEQVVSPAPSGSEVMG